MAASLYSLPSESRLDGAVAAHKEGLGIHVDVILRQRDGGCVNVGVSEEELRHVVRTLPEARVDIHLMGEPGGGEEIVGGFVRVVRDTPRVRWTGSPELLALVPDDALARAEVWGQLWRPTPREIAQQRSAGVLVMLIEPATANEADVSQLAVCAELSQKGHRVGIDGGVTEEVAARAVEVGVSYVVSGRALFVVEEIDRLAP